MPKAWRSQLSGILARFSAQSVSIRPALGLLLATVKPLSVQKSIRRGNTSSGGRSTTSQRRSPSRSTRMSVRAGSTLLVLGALACASPCCWNCEYVVEPEAGAR